MKARQKQGKTSSMAKSAALSLLVVVFLCQCESTQPKTTTRSSTYSFDQQLWGTQAEDADTKKIKNRYTNHGFTIDDDGNFKANKTDLYGDSDVRGVKKMFRTKDAKLKQAKFDSKTFKTPEYLKMQDFKGTKDARESGNLAREGDFKKSRWRDGKKLFRNNSKKSSEYASYDTGQNEMGSKMFSTGQNTQGLTATEKSPEAVATLPSAGFKVNTKMTKDDVKKMINPNGYAQGTGLSN